MKISIFEFGKQPLHEWMQVNPDCECMKLVGNVYDNFYVDYYNDKKESKKYTHEIKQGNDAFDLLYGFERIVKSSMPKMFDVSDLHLVDENGELCEDEVSAEATEYQPSLIMKMLYNRSHGTKFIVKGDFITSEDGKTLISSLKKKGVVEVPAGITTIGRIAFAVIDKGILEVVLPEGVVSIEESAFEMSDALKKISLPDSLTSLGESAFYGAELEELSLPDGIEEIPACCFCFNSIEKLKLPRNLKYVRACGLAGLYCDEVVLPEGTEIIESESIEGYYEKIFIPKSLREIAKDFYYEDGIDDYPESFRPYITVHPENPYFESHNGVLYKRGKKKRYL